MGGKGEGEREGGDVKQREHKFPVQRPFECRRDVYFYLRCRYIVPADDRSQINVTLKLNLISPAAVRVGGPAETRVVTSHKSTRASRIPRVSLLARVRDELRIIELARRVTYTLLFRSLLHSSTYLR